jgi:hypothetical protein
MLLMVRGRREKGGGRRMEGAHVGRRKKDQGGGRRVEGNEGEGRGMNSPPLPPPPPSD